MAYSHYIDSADHFGNDMADTALLSLRMTMNFTPHTAKRYIVVVLLCSINIIQAHAKIDLISTQIEPSLGRHVQVKTAKKESFLVKSGHRKISSDVEFFLYTRKLKCNSKEPIKEFRAPSNYIISPSLSYALHHSPLIAMVDIGGKWEILRLHKNLSTILQTIPLHDFSMVLSIATSPSGYFLGGTGPKETPFIKYFNHDLKKSRSINFDSNQRGEISALLENQGRMLSIVNYYVDKERHIPPSSVFHIYSATGNFLSEIPLDGIGATAISLKKGGLAIGYWRGRQLHLEIRGKDFDVQFQTMLHEIQGIASTSGRLLEVEDDIAWIGINDEKLVVHRVNQFRNSVRTSMTTAESGFRPSGIDTPHAHAYGKDLHILSTIFRQDSPDTYQLTEFCFIESTDH